MQEMPILPDNHSKHEPLKLSFRDIMEPMLVLFNLAAERVLPGKPYYISYSVPGGVYGYFKDYEAREEELRQIHSEIGKMLRTGKRFNQQPMQKEALMDYFDTHGRQDITHLLRSRENNARSLDGLQLAHTNGAGELLLESVHENHERLAGFKLFKYRKGFFLIADRDFYQRVMPGRIEISKYFRRFEESEETMKFLGISSFAELNDVISQGRLPEFVKIAEAYQSRRISRIADNIISHPLKPRVIFLAGPTSSGKTTSANRLAIELRVIKKQALILSLDNYYLPHSRIPDDPATGMKNFELLSALDLNLFMENIHDLLAGKPIHLPKYHFDGKGPVPEEKLTGITDDTYIIVEGIHGLNPGLWKNVMDMESYRLYVSALTTLNIHDHLPFSTSDHRLIRRLVRDHLFRGYDFNETIMRWPDVMQNEYQSIFPFQESANAIFNSALIYEIAVFAFYAPQILRPEKAINEVIRKEAQRLNRMLSLLIPINPSDIPPTSILREFIGGSSFNY
jgi:uridine kinase